MSKSALVKVPVDSMNDEIEVVSPEGSLELTVSGIGVGNIVAEKARAGAF